MNLNEKLNIKIFSSTAERINIYLPIGFLILSILGIISGYQPSLSEKNSFLSLGYFVFMNHAHIYLTPLLLFLLPEGRRWCQSATLYRKNFVYLVFSFFVLFYLLLALLGFYDYVIFLRVISYIFIVRMIFGTYHNLFQSYGMTCIYRFMNKHKMSNSGRLQQKNRLLIFLIWGVGTTNFVLTHLRFAGFEGSLTQKGLLVLTIFLVILVLLLNIYEFNYKITNSFFHLLRLFLFALSPISIIAFSGYLAAHGLEYLLLYLHMKKNSETELSQATTIIVSFLLMAILSAPAFIINNMKQFTFSVAAMIFITAFLNTGDLIHYVLDSLLFKFSRVATKKNILPLIIVDSEKLTSS